MITAYINNARDEWVQVTLSGPGAPDLTTQDIERALNEGTATPPPQADMVGLEAQLDAVWNAAVEQAAVIANDCVHLTPDPGAAIRVMLDGRTKLHQPATQATETNVAGIKEWDHRDRNFIRAGESRSYKGRIFVARHDIPADAKANAPGYSEFWAEGSADGR